MPRGEAMRVHDDARHGPTRSSSRRAGRSERSIPNVPLVPVQAREEAANSPALDAYKIIPLLFLIVAFVLDTALRLPA